MSEPAGKDAATRSARTSSLMPMSRFLEYSPTKWARTRWGKIEGHDSVRRQNIAKRAGVALSRWPWRASYSKPSDDIRDVFFG